MWEGRPGGSATRSDEVVRARSGLSDPEPELHPRYDVP
ncbi:hypothetical protein T261_4607 [Streptomyces lydicus]|nr:hypothetical protein T261_4607 [Streptomyces lydicus]